MLTRIAALLAACALLGGLAVLPALAQTPTACAAPRSCIHLPLIGLRFPSLAALNGIVNGGFEAGGEGWRESSDPARELIRDRLDGSTRPRSGFWAAWLGNAYGSTQLIAQRLTIAPATPFLGYWYWIKSREDSCGRGGDIADVLVDPTPDGDLGDAAVVDSFPLCQRANTLGWIKRSADLRAYSGRVVEIAFRVRTNTTPDSDSNLFLDDIAFQATR